MHKLTELTPDHVRAMWAQKRREVIVTPKGKKKNNAAASIDRMQAVLRAALQDAMRDEKLVRNVAKLVKMPKAEKPAIEP